MAHREGDETHTGWLTAREKERQRRKSEKNESGAPECIKQTDAKWDSSQWVGLASRSELSHDWHIILLMPGIISALSYSDGPDDKLHKGILYDKDKKKILQSTYNYFLLHILAGMDSIYYYISWLRED